MKNICYYVCKDLNAYYEVGIQSIEKYCNTHNIDIKRWDKIDERYTHPKYDKRNNIWYQKIATIDDFVNSDYDNYMLVDLDMLFNSEAPNIFDLIEEDVLYSEYAPNAMIDTGGVIEIGNAGLILFNKNVAKKILLELQPDKIDVTTSADQINLAKARIRAGVPFKRIDKKWNYMIWEHGSDNVVQDLIDGEIYFIHYGNVNIQLLHRHINTNQKFKNKVL